MADSWRIRGNSESLLSAYLTDHARRTDGSKSRFAQRTGIPRWQLSELAAGMVLRDAETELIAAELGMTPDLVRILGGISLKDASNFLLKSVAAGTYPSGPEAAGASAGASSEALQPHQVQVDNDLQRRFVGLMRKREEPLPSAAFIIFLTGDLSTQTCLVDLLEQHGDAFPATTPAATFELVLSLSSGAAG